jgi:hypothetical protein
MFYHQHHYSIETDICTFKLQFFGFHDGTIIMIKCEENSDTNSIAAASKLSNIHFTILWQIKLSFPVLGLSYGQLLPRDDDQNEKKGKEFENRSIESNNINVVELMSDQLTAVTTKSFHLFSSILSYSAYKNDVANVDRLISDISSF